MQRHKGGKPGQGQGRAQDTVFPNAGGIKNKADAQQQHGGAYGKNTGVLHKSDSIYKFKTPHNNTGLRQAKHGCKKPLPENILLGFARRPPSLERASYAKHRLSDPPEMVQGFCNLTPKRNINKAAGIYCEWNAVFIVHKKTPTFSEPKGGSVYEACRNSTLCRVSLLQVFR
ncbi:hypothetical protein LJC36_04410 [Desulfovibrio sp. OttesenSCG-928-C14]|nr:hypothetical protein [Desulfovibrio sp. OttesenSCG-928-C14]